MGRKPKNKDGRRSTDNDDEEGTATFIVLGARAFHHGHCMPPSHMSPVMRAPGGRRSR